MRWSEDDGEWEAAPPERGVLPLRSLRLLTWNVYFGDHQFEARRDALVARLGRLALDVIALQEVTPDLLSALLSAEWVRAGYQVGVQLDGSYEPIGSYGVVLLTRVPVRRLWQVALPTGMGRALLCAMVAADVTVGTVHLESLGEVAHRVEQLRIIQPHLGALPGDAVLCGDMNFPDGAPAETAALDRRFVDTWPRLRPGQPGFTVDTDLNLMRYELKGRRSQKRIDRIFLKGAAWQARAIELVGTEAIDADGTCISDHFGLLVELSR